MRARELILEHRSHEAIVEEAGRAVDDVKRLGLWVIDPDSTRGAEDRGRGKWWAAGLAGQRVRPGAQGGAHRHSVKPIGRGAGRCGVAFNAANRAFTTQGVG